MKAEHLLDKVLLCQYMAERLARGADTQRLDVQAKLVTKLGELYQELGEFIVEQVTDKQPQSIKDLVKSLPVTQPAPPTDNASVYMPRCGKCGITLSQVMSYCCPNNDCPCGLGGISCGVARGAEGLTLNAGKAK